jgi:riboflavin transporter FmnP
MHLNLEPSDLVLLWVFRPEARSVFFGVQILKLLFYIFTEDCERIGSVMELIAMNLSVEPVRLINGKLHVLHH